MIGYTRYSLKFEGGDTTVLAPCDAAALMMAEEVAQELEVDSVEVWAHKAELVYVGSRP